MRTGLAFGALLVVVVAGWTAAFTRTSPTPTPLPITSGSSATDDTATTTTANATRFSDFNRDGFTDLVARDTTGRLWLYPGNGTGGFLARHLMATV
jgi:hypothetical protein